MDLLLEVISRIQGAFIPNMSSISKQGQNFMVNSFMVENIKQAINIVKFNIIEVIRVTNKIIKVGLNCIREDILLKIRELWVIFELVHLHHLFQKEKNHQSPFFITNSFSYHFFLILLITSTFLNNLHILIFEFSLGLFIKVLAINITLINIIVIHIMVRVKPAKNYCFLMIFSFFYFPPSLAFTIAKNLHIPVFVY
jgi:hypothetical protein